MMRFRTLMVLSVGLAAGYVAGTAAGRPAFERMRSVTGSMVTDLGLTDAGQRLRERGDDLARASVDLASTAMNEVVDGAADKVEQQLMDAQSRLQGGSFGNGDSRG